MYPWMQSRLAPTLSRLTIVLLLAAAMVRGLLPAGFMLAPAADAQSIVIEMCGSGTHAYRLDLATGKTSLIEEFATEDGNASRAQATMDCPFALASSPALSGGQISAPLPAASTPADLDVLSQVFGRQAGAGFPPPARGPPGLF
jgi:hypothetical protein